MSHSTNKKLNQRSRSGTSDRRSGSDRRRNADCKQPVIHVTPSELHVVIHVERGGGQRELAICRSIPWQQESESLYSPHGQRELTDALSKLCQEERLAGCSAVLVLSTDYCVTRAVTGTAEEVQRVISQLRERSQLYLSLGPGKKVSANSSTPLDARHSHTLLTIASEQTLLILSRAIESAGMEVAAIRASQVALARIVHHLGGDKPEADLVISVDHSRVELAVMNGGHLFLDYQPGGDDRIEHLADLLSQHHTRLKRYCQRHRSLANETLSRVVISGRQSQAKLAQQAIVGLKTLQVSLLQIPADQLPWEIRGDDFGPEMAAPLGATLLLSEPTERQGPNLAAQLTDSSRPPLMGLILPRLAPLAAVLLVSLGMSLLNWSTSRKLDRMKQELTQLAPQAARAANLRSRLLADKLEIDQLKLLEQKLQRQPYGLLIKNLQQTIPPEVWLSSVRMLGDQTASLAGTSYTEASIYDLVGHLRNLPGVGQVALQGTGTGRSNHRDATTFDIELNLDFDGQEETTAEAL